MKSVNLFLTFLYFVPITLFAQFQNIGGPAKAETIDVVFVNDTIYALTTASLQYSTNEGSSWNMVPGSNDLPSYLSNVSIDGDAIYISVRFDFIKNVIYRTDDFGQTWTQVQDDTFYSQGNIAGFDSFNDSLYIYSNGNSFLSTDGGETVRVIEALAQNFPFVVVHNRIVHFEGDHYFLAPEGLVRTNDFDTYDLLFEVNTENVYRLFRNESELFLMEKHFDGRNIYKLVEGEIILDRENLLGIFLSDTEAIYYDGDLVYTSRNSPEFSFDAWETSEWIPLNNSFDWPSYLLKIKDGEMYIDNLGQLYRMTINDSIPVNITNNMMGDKNLSIRKVGSKLICEYDPPAYYDLEAEEWHLLDDVAEATYFINENTLVQYDKGNSKDSISITTIDGQLIKKSKLPDGNLGFSDHMNAMNDLIFVAYNTDTLYVTSDLGDTWQILHDDIRREPFVNFSNGNILVWTITGPIFVSSDSLNFIANDTGQNGIRKASIDDAGNVYYMDYNSVYKQDQLTGEFMQIPMPFDISSNNDDNDYSIEHYGNALFVGGYGQGLFVTFNDGETYETFNEGLGSRNISSLEVDDEFIYVGAYGHIFKRPLDELNAVSYTGVIFEDINENGTKEADESLISDVQVRTTQNNIIISTDEEGKFALITRDVLDNKIEIIERPYTSTTNGPILLEDSQDPIELGLSFDKESNDIAIKILSPFVFRPGFPTEIQLHIENLTYNDRIVDIDLSLDDKLFFASSSYTPYTLEESDLKFEDVLLEGRGSTNISLVLETDVTSTLGDLVSLQAYVELVDFEDNELNNNDYELIDTIRGSYDPNDKLVYPSSDLTFDENISDRELIYTIRFQNTGNYPAEFVRLRDTIETDLDISSLEVLSFSHQCEWQVRGGRVFEVFFPYINLPDSTVSQELSQGYVTFKIKADKDVSIGTSLENKAAIYFDYNPPIITETVISEIVAPLSTKESTISNLLVIPNPARNHIMLDSELLISGAYTIIDVLGRRVAGGYVDNFNNSKILINHLAKGQYILVLNDEISENRFTSKFVKI